MFVNSIVGRVVIDKVEVLWSDNAKSELNDEGDCEYQL